MHATPRLARAVRAADDLASVDIAFAGTDMTICALASDTPFPNIIFDALVMAVGVFFTIAACQARGRDVRSHYHHRWL
jgi:hypothetical protein